MKKMILSLGIGILLLLSACKDSTTWSVEREYCLSQGFAERESVYNYEDWVNWKCVGNSKESQVFVNNPVYYIKLGQAICEERYKKDFDSFDGITLNCKARPKTEKYDGIRITP